MLEEILRAFQKGRLRCLPGFRLHQAERFILASDIHISAKQGLQVGDAGLVSEDQNQPGAILHLLADGGGIGDLTIQHDHTRLREIINRGDPRQGEGFAHLALPTGEKHAAGIRGPR